jgi:uncharacterized repeat protein (TIGR01451 family)
MRQLKRTHAGILTLFVVVTILGITTLARTEMTNRLANTNTKPDVKLTITAIAIRDGKEVFLNEKSVVNPGDILKWQLTSENKGTGPALQYRAVGEVPKGTSLIAGSVQAERAIITYSIDGGKTFSAQPIIEERQSDGTIKRVSAPISMYTEVCYEWSDPLPANSQVSAFYNVSVK